MKQLIMTCIAACVLSSIAAETSTTNALTAAEKEAKAKARRELMLQKTGGIVDMPGKGKVVFVNCQNTVSEAEVAARVDKIAYVLKYNCEIRRGTWQFGLPRPEDANVAIFLVDDEKLPMSLVAVEAQWGVVNTHGLKLGSRFSKELTRVFCLVAGAAHSQVKTSPMQTVAKPTDLDKLTTDGFTFDMATSIMTHMNELGVTRSRKTSYRKACEEGWAAQPTNAYQQAIWDKVHALPKNPMKIEFDPKKGR